MLSVPLSSDVTLLIFCVPRLYRTFNVYLKVNTFIICYNNNLLNKKQYYWEQKIDVVHFIYLTQCYIDCDLLLVFGNRNELPCYIFRRLLEYLLRIVQYEAENEIYKYNNNVDSIET